MQKVLLFEFRCHLCQGSITQSSNESYEAINDIPFVESISSEMTPCMNTKILLAPCIEVAR